MTQDRDTHKDCLLLSSKFLVRLPWEADQSNASFEYGVDGHTEKVIQLTIDRARVVLKVQNHGNFLFIRWESFVNTAHRRYFLFIMMFFDFLVRWFHTWTGTDLRHQAFLTQKILFDWDGKQSLGNSHSNNYIFDLTGTTGHVPSYAIDSLFLLQKSTQIILENVLNEIAEDEGGKISQSDLHQLLHKGNEIDDAFDDPE